MSNIIAFPNTRDGNSRFRMYERCHIKSGDVTGAVAKDTVTPFRKPGRRENRTALDVLVSVVVPTCNRPQLLDRCLAALAAQDFDAERFEIVVVDDKPSAETKAVIEHWNKRLVHWGPHVFYLQTCSPHGPAAARNRGWEDARGALIAFTDDDTIPRTDWLRNGTAMFDGRIQATWGRIVMPLNGISSDTERETKGLEHAEFVTANCFCLKHVLARLGGFDERFRLAWREDADLYFRLLQSGAAIAYAPEAVVEHPIRTASWGASISRQKKIQFDAVLFKKHRILYREKIRASIRWDFYLIAFCLLAAPLFLVLNRFWIALTTSLCWLVLSTRFFMQRLHGTENNASHVTETIATSLLIPPLAVFWRIVGAIRFRIGFI